MLKARFMVGMRCFYVVSEFIYAQSPGYMKGVLIGCLFTTEGIAMLLGSLLFVVLTESHTNLTEVFGTCSSPCTCKNDSNSFAVALYTIVVIIALLSFIMFRCVVRRFVVRKRENDLVYFSRSYM